MIKFFRKTFTRDATKAQSDNDIPLKGVVKKRNKTFGFLQFKDAAEKSDFTELFSMTVAPVKRYRLREVTKLDANKGFKSVKDKAQMAEDSLRRKEQMHASIT